MSDFSSAMAAGIQLLASGDPDLLEIVRRSLTVSLAAVAIAAGLGLPFAAWLAVARFRGRALLVALVNTAMGLPPVVVGLVVYLVLSRSGPLGALGWLFTPTAMIVAQTLLVLPIVAAVALESLESLWEEYEAQIRALGSSAARAIPTLLWDGRYRLMTALLAGFGRAIAEVGAVMIVGGNIAHQTRVMTTAIALETSKGDLPLALGLGVVLLVVALTVTALGRLAAASARAFAS